MKVMKDKNKTVILKLIKEYSVDSSKEENKIFYENEENIKRLMIELAEGIGVDDSGNSYSISSIRQNDVIVRVIGNGSQIEIMRIYNIKVYDIMNIDSENKEVDVKIDESNL